jgi:predicted MFS family arabinose efflux permease
MAGYLLRQYRQAFSGLPREVWVLALVLLVNRTGTMVFPFLALYLTSRFGMGATTTGGMIALYGLGSITGAFVGGRIVERFGAIRLQTTCLFLASLAIAFVPFCQTPTTLGVALFAMSAVSDAVRPANATAITRVTTGVNRTQAFALQRLAANLGLSIGPAAGGVLALFHYYWLFAVDAISTLASALLILAVFRMRRLAGEEPDRPAEVVPRSPLLDGPFAAFLLLMLATEVVFVQLLATYPLYLRDHLHFSKPAVGAMFALNTLIIVVVEMPLIGAIKRRNLAHTVGWGSLAICLGYALLPWGRSVWLVVVSMAVITLGEMLVFPLATAMAASRAGPGREGRYLGWHITMFSVAIVVGPIVGSQLYAVNPHWVWHAGSVVGALALPGFYWLAKVWDAQHAVETLHGHDAASLPAAHALKRHAPRRAPRTTHDAAMLACEE